MATLFVGNLSPEVTDGDLRTVFEQYGRVNSVRLISRRRLAYIDLEQEAAQAAVEGLRGTQLKGRTVDVVLDSGPPGGRPGGKRRIKRRR